MTNVTTEEQAEVTHNVMTKVRKNSAILVTVVGVVVALLTAFLVSHFQRTDRYGETLAVHNERIEQVCAAAEENKRRHELLAERVEKAVDKLEGAVHALDIRIAQSLGELRGLILQVLNGKEEK